MSTDTLPRARRRKRRPPGPTMAAAFDHLARVRCYASDELLDWFAEHGRTTFAEYERHRQETP